MRLRPLTIASLILAVIGTACGSGSADTELRTLAYQFAPGESYAYDSTLSLDVTLDFGAIPAGGGDVPGSTDVGFELSGTTAYSFADGDEPGTYRATVDQKSLRFERLSMSIGDEDLEFTDGAAINAIMAEESPFPDGLVYVVDRRGSILSMEIDGSAVPLDEFGSPNPFGGFGQSSPFLGPELPEGPTAVGDTWTTTYVQPLIPGREGFTVTSIHRVAAEEMIDGVAVLVIETSSESTPVTFDLGELMSSAAQGPGFEGLGTVDVVELRELGSIGMTMTLESLTGGSTSWFDPTAGVVVRQRFDAAMELTMGVEGAAVTSGGGTVTMIMRSGGDLMLRR